LESRALRPTRSQDGAVGKSIRKAAAESLAEAQEDGGIRRTERKRIEEVTREQHRVENEVGSPRRRKGRTLREETPPRRRIAGKVLGRPLA
jgi:hypothetical protein